MSFYVHNLRIVDEHEKTSTNSTTLRVVYTETQHRSNGSVYGGTIVILKNIPTLHSAKLIISTKTQLIAITIINHITSKILNHRIEVIPILILHSLQLVIKKSKI